MYFYRVYGLRVASEIEMNDVIEEENSIDDVDVIISISKCKVSGIMKEMLDEGRVQHYEKNDGWFKIKDLAVFRIMGGNKVLIYLDEKYDEDVVYNSIGRDYLKTFILGTCLGYILIQKGIVTIHGGAVTAGGGAVIVSGAQGAGKSTTISKLIDIGFSFIADDVSTLKVNNNGEIIVMPAFPQRKLCRDAMIRLGMDVSKYELYDELRDKFKVPSFEFFSNEESKVSCIYCLEWVDDLGENRSPHIIEVFGVEKIKLIMDNIFRIEIIRAIGIEMEYFKKCIEVARGVRVYRSLRRKNR